MESARLFLNSPALVLATVVYRALSRSKTPVEGLLEPISHEGRQGAPQGAIAFPSTLILTIKTGSCLNRLGKLDRDRLLRRVACGRQDGLP
jgi:hypothetical protein